MRLHNRTKSGVAPRWSLGALCLALLLPPAVGKAAASEPSAPYLAALIDEARRLQLAEQRPWRLLLHYRRTWTGGYRSEADGPDFFVAARGKRDPQAELEATLGAFFAPDVAGGQHPQCQFPARYHWLQEQLDFDPGRLQQRDCPRFEEWRARLKPASVTVVFADAYLDNPPSMYGHTFLRLDRAGRSDGERLLDYAVNYSADANTRNGIVFAAKGLLGGYPGRFSTTPFYIKVQEYINLESRDLWEYRLNLDQEQIDRLVRHLWELGTTYFDYYFLTENCSYQLLPLLEVADPSLRLTERLKPWVIPVDTIRLLLEQPGLVTQTAYRPSHLKKMLHKRARLAPEEVPVARAVSLRMDAAAAAALDRLPAARQALVLDAAYDYYRYRQGFGMDQSAAQKQVERRILLRRRQLGRQPQLSAGPLAGTPPQSGHKSGRLGVGVGVADGAVLTRIALRPALQDLAGDHTGYLPDSHLEMFHLQLRLDGGRRLPALEKLALLEIVSIAPWDPWIRERSWKAGTGLYRAQGLGCGAAGCLYYGFNAGWGMSAQTRRGKRAVYYLLAEIDAGVGGSFRGAYRAGGGGRGGVLLDVADFWRLHLEGALVDYAAGDRRGRYETRLEQVFTWSTNFETRLSYHRQQGYEEAAWAFNLYF